MHSFHVSCHTLLQVLIKLTQNFSFPIKSIYVQLDKIEIYHK